MKLPPHIRTRVWLLLLCDGHSYLQKECEWNIINVPLKLPADLRKESAQARQTVITVVL